MRTRASCGTIERGKPAPAALADFIRSTTSGDATTFTTTFPVLDWTGAWREAFTRLVAGGAINPTIRPVLIENWRRMKAQGPGPHWHLERDLDDDLDLMLDGLRMLMPPLSSRPPPLVLYRGQRRENYRAGRVGAWWTLDPTYAEIFAGSPSRRGDRMGAVLITFNPHCAIVGGVRR